MTKDASIKIEKRDFSIKPGQLRASGKFPATIYGHGFDSISVQLDTKAFQKAFRGDKTALLELKLDKNIYPVLVKNIQYHGTANVILGVEFYRIKTDEKVKIKIPVLLSGISPAVKAGGTLWNPTDEIEVECLPDNIPANIEIDISKLENFEDSVSVGDIKYPKGVTPIAAIDSVVVKINAPKTVTAEGAEAVQSAEIARLTES